MRYTLMVNVRIYIVIIDVDHKVYHYQKGVFVIVQATYVSQKITYFLDKLNFTGTF